MAAREAVNELPETLADLDRRIYLALTAARSGVVVFLVVLVATANVLGLVWWLFGLAALRARGLGRRGIAIVLTVAFGLIPAWVTGDALKVVFQRPRPFLDIPGVDLLIAAPTTFSFPSGDTAGAFGAAVALGHALPRLRWLAILIATAIGISRVAVGVHYPSDVIGGAIVGIAFGLLAPLLVAEILRRMAWDIYVVPHTHWDREWYSRFEVYRARLVTMMGKLLDLLEQDPQFRVFTFDGHTIAIEDHLAVVPQDRPRIEKLIREDRLLVGPWYVLADYLLVSGESIVRNFQEGLRTSGELGRAMRVCYVADPFGHPAQMPQIARGFGYTTYVFARGVGDEGEELGSEFQWEAPSGDRVLASHQVAHYDNALVLVGDGEESPAALGRRVRKALPALMRSTVPYAQSRSLLFMVGTDHTEPYTRLPEAVAVIADELSASAPRIDGLEAFAASLRTPPGVLAGEMVAGKYRPILRGVNSTRVWIKQRNAECERLLLDWCEPLDAMAGGVARDALRSAWRTLLENHPHDSICGCGIDEVHDLDMAPRFDRVRSDGTALIAELAGRLGGNGDVPIVWSALPWDRTAVVDLDDRPTLVRCPGFGSGPVERWPAVPVRTTAPGVIENGRLRVEVALEGTFAITDIASGERWERQNVLVDEGDRGDEYTFSYAGPTVEGAAREGTLATAVTGDRATVTVTTVARVPVGLRADRTARDSATVDMPLRITVSLEAAAERVDVELEVDNGAKDHRLRVDLATGTRTLTHHAGAAFALLERANRVPARPGWVEPPTPERCVHDIVAVTGATRGLAVGVDGMRDYAVVKDGGTISVTLLRAMGWLSRGDLRERRGHAGPALETPSAQCPGPQRFRYTAIPLVRDRDLGAATRMVREWLSPAWVGRGDGERRTYLSLNISPPDAVAQLTALRAGPDGSLVVRIASLVGKPAEVTLRSDRLIGASRPADLREGVDDLGNNGLDVIRTAAPMSVLPEGTAVARLGPYEIGTWLVQLA